MNQTSFSAKWVGIPWFRPEDYDESRAAMDDDLLPDFWATWYTAASMEEALAQRTGCRVIRAYIEPVTFSLWCRKRGLNVLNGDARRAYASAYASRIVVN